LIDLKQMEALVKKVLGKLGAKYATDDAVELVMATGLVESRFKYLQQLNDGVAFSFWQIEPWVALDNCTNYLSYRPHIIQDCVDATKVVQAVWENGNEGDWRYLLHTNLAVGIVHCRLKYWRVPKRIPLSTIRKAEYWKEFYNTEKGAGDPDDYVRLAGKYL
jgi:hypothetical protein|tara:strand:+ start:653 stop:1138 length:486 start_codon:yes stop_codon:yes gene_type:complete